jgi:hypothetical protein
MPGKKAMAVDNQLCNDLDLSVIDPSVFMVEWRDSGTGEIEVIGNGLRSNFIDITPFAQIFQQFLGKVPNLQLGQAKKVQNDLIAQIGSAKQQAPFHYPVAAGDYYWDPSNPTGNASLTSVTQNLVTKTNEISSKLNSAMPALDNSDAVIVAGINSNIGTPHNQMLIEINTSIVPSITTSVTALSNATQSQNVVDYNGLNVPVAQPGMSGGAPAINALTSASGASSITRAAVPWTSVSGVASPNIDWVPVGSSTSVAVTPAEAAAIIQGIAARSNDLTGKQNIKVGQVNSLTTIAAVIAYDVTTGW